MIPKVRENILQHQDLIIEDWMQQIEKFRTDESLQSISASVYESTSRDFVHKLLLTVEENEVSDEKLNQFVERLIQMGWPLNYITRGLQEFRKVSVKVIFQETDNNEDQFRMIEEIEEWVDEIVNLLVNQYSGSWENTVFLQKMALKELSAPLIPVFENISVMPLVGTIDTERAKLIMENLLDGVIEHRSQVVLIDITGVPVVDTMVAHHIIQASEAVRLVGAQCILVGIRPEIAQTIVNLGIDLGKFPTKSTLKKGVETALRMTKRDIVELES
ncbi:RsbT co-antagonist protein RsbRA [Alkalicoccus saliphilus]|jgi:rsbT co-antagonist protein RsbR|uniref:RsbT co-antagonist protein RsbRA n=1 Tax=Alkalicoccus saliphilus TaxID=200989 RepID=A0A2T4U594_9BACI|nr:RsbT co-antagonist protein RsbRA [Alkalicoccus saliphilus]PTL38577.1 RsbT co-antagonist protein RsbRA [Alkalicoccus saliphilus]